MAQTDKWTAGMIMAGINNEMTAGAQDIPRTITSLVAALYEKRPYPHYPLLAKPRWQDGYLVSSMFAQSIMSSSAIAGNLQGKRSDSPSTLTIDSEAVLIAGCGEILPYIIRQWEPRHFQVIAVDLSQRSLRRARFRLAFSLAPREFIKADINDFIKECKNTGRKFRHVEAFGVFHHVWSPEQTIAGIADRITENGTMRAMVYNGTSRHWIHRIQSVLATLGLNCDSDKDVKTSQRIVKVIAESSPLYAKKISQMGPSILKNKTRFADTFMHPHEVPYTVDRWIDSFTAAGLVVKGIFDRFGELDDLPNPLFQAPTKEALELRARDFRFENNLEVFLGKANTTLSATLTSEFQNGEAMTTVKPVRPATRLKFMNPPAIWFSFKETESLNPIFRQMVWLNFLSHLSGKRKDLPAGLKKLPTPTLQRLSRLGAIQLTTAMPSDLIDTLMAPMAREMTPPIVPAMTPLESTKIHLWLTTYVATHNLSVASIDLIKTLEGEI